MSYSDEVNNKSKVMYFILGFSILIFIYLLYKTRRFLNLVESKYIRTDRNGGTYAFASK